MDVSPELESRLTSLSRPYCMVVVGTRPEAIKMAPVIRCLCARSKEFRHKLVVTAQHREILDQALQMFGLRVDIDLNLMQEAQRLPRFAAEAVAKLADVIRQERPDFVLVQGDTTTVLAASLAAFYEKIPIGHVEAGLRSNDKHNPFPEEINRRLATVLADLHFAPTEQARENLIREGIDPGRIFVTGNPVIDALRIIKDEAVRFAINRFAFLGNGFRTVLVTAHRRENHGEPLDRICEAISVLVRQYPDVQVIWPVHPNPVVKVPVHNHLAGKERIHLVEPMDYCVFVGVMALSDLVLTDSGGVQEEAPALGKPVLVMRDTTERPEGVLTGVSRLVGTTESRIVDEAARLLTSEVVYHEMAREVCPYGDGRAAERILSAIYAHFDTRAVPWDKPLIASELI